MCRFVRVLQEMPPAVRSAQHRPAHAQFNGCIQEVLERVRHQAPAEQSTKVDIDSLLAIF